MRPASKSENYWPDLYPIVDRSRKATKCTWDIGILPLLEGRKHPAEIIFTYQ